VISALKVLQGKRMKIVNPFYHLIDKFHVQNSQWWCGDTSLPGIQAATVRLRSFFSAVKWATKPFCPYGAHVNSQTFGNFGDRDVAAGFFEKENLFQVVFDTGCHHR
jgi:hypothetical protein